MLQAGFGGPKEFEPIGKTARQPGNQTPSHRRILEAGEPKVEDREEAENYQSGGIVERNGLFIPTGTLGQRLVLAAKNERKMTSLVRGQLGMEILQATPEEREENGIYIFAHLPDNTLKARFPSQAIAYDVIFTRVFRPRRTGENPGCKYLDVSRYDLLSQRMGGEEYGLINGKMPKDILDMLKEIDQMVAGNTQLINHPVLHLKLLRDIVKCCDTGIKPFENPQGNALKGGNIVRPYSRDNNPEKNRWNEWKHKAVAEYLQYAREVIQKRYGLADIYYITTNKWLGNNHRTIEMNQVDIEKRLLILEIFGFSEPGLAEETIEVRPDSLASKNDSTNINVTALKQKVRQATVTRSYVSEQEKWLAAFFSNYV